jgi:hypothetical protein
MPSGSAERLAGVVASTPASAFAFRDFGESLHEQGHKQDNGHPCIGDNDSKHIASLRSVERDISDPCTLQCASINASCQHSVASQDNDHPRADTWQHDEARVNAAAGVVEPADDPTLPGCHWSLILRVAREPSQRLLVMETPERVLAETGLDLARLEVPPVLPAQS